MLATQHVIFRLVVLQERAKKIIQRTEHLMEKKGHLTRWSFFIKNKMDYEDGGVALNNKLVVFHPVTTL